MGHPGRGQAARRPGRRRGDRRRARLLKLAVRVPATVANLGPGFDSFGLALSLFNEIEIDTDAEPSVRIEGEGADELPRDDSNLVLRSMRAFATAAGRELPPIAVACTNRIPLERGLGSSAAAVVGGLAA